jgi:hypothetical protein
MNSKNMIYCYFLQSPLLVLPLADPDLHNNKPYSIIYYSSISCNLLQLSNIVQASLSIPVNPTRHFSYSSGSRSSMYLLMLVLASFLIYDISLLTVDNLTCSTWISPFGCIPYCKAPCCSIPVLKCSIS